MHVTLHWDNAPSIEPETVVRWDFRGVIGLVNYIVPINETAQRAIMSDADTVDAILNIGWTFPFPNRPFRYIAQAILAAPPALDHIVIAANPLARLILNWRLLGPHPALAERVTVVGSLAAARQVIAERRVGEVER